MSCAWWPWRRSSVAWGLALAALCAGGQAAAQPELLPVREWRPGVWVHEGAIGEWPQDAGGDVANLGFVVGSRCVAVIDTGGTPAIGERLRRTIERVTPLPVCFVVNTHMHPDHVLGNAAFATLVPRPQFVAHARLAASLAARERGLANALQRDAAITLPAGGVVYPDRTVADRLELALGGRTLLLVAWPTSHTDNDLTVYDDGSRTLFTSDLVFVGHLPALDGSLRGWLKTLDSLARLDVALAVPGHGAPGSDWPGLLAPQRAYLDALLTQTRAAVKARETLPQAVAHVALPQTAGWQLVEAFHRRNVTAAFAELEWED